MRGETTELLAISAATLFASLFGSLFALPFVPPAAAQERDRGVHFASFDVGIGAALPEGADAGLSYGVGFDLANLPAGGLATRFGFRFWSARDESAGVDIDDGVLELLLKARAGSGTLSGYAGAGVGAHFVSARLADMPEVQDERDGFHAGLRLLAGGEAALGDDFLAVFLEGAGSVLSEIPHAVIHAGIRVRFDRL